MTGEPSISEWLKNREILITGATGFVGKLVVAKLLATCSDDGGNIYLLIREKKGASPSTRLNALIQQEPFRAIRENHPERLKRLVVVSGDTALENLGLSTKDKARVVENVSVIIHMAANVRFDLSLRTAVSMNTNGAANVISFAKQLENLASLIHVSTAYCHCGLSRLEERAYAPSIHPEDMIMLVDKLNDDLLRLLEPALLGDQPNTYAFSKCLSEDLMVRSGLPVGIARPSIVTASLREPVPGWVDNLNGPTGLMVGGGKGVIRSMHCNEEYNADIIPCDLVANAVIALARRVALENPSTPIVVNVTEGGRNPLAWGTAINTGKRHVNANPFSGILWYPDGKITSYWILHWICVMLFHLLPAYTLDTLIGMTGNKPFLVRVQSRVATGLELLQYYTTKKWEFPNDKLKDLENRLCPEDKAAFPMTTENICWDDYLYNYIMGIRKYCLKDDPSTLPRARQVLRYYYIADRILRTLFGVAVAWFIYSLVVPRQVTTSFIETVGTVGTVGTESM